MLRKVVVGSLENKTDAQLLSTLLKAKDINQLQNKELQRLIVENAFSAISPNLMQKYESIKESQKDEEFEKLSLNKVTTNKDP